MLAGGGISVEETADAADGDVVFARKRIAVGYDEALVMADRIACCAANAARPMRLRTESGSAMHGSLDPLLVVGKVFAQTMYFPYTMRGWGRCRHAMTLRRGALVLRAPEPCRARSGAPGRRPWPSMR